MSVITQNTNIRLLKVPIGINQANQLTFANINSQYTYFNSLNKKVLENATYVRESEEICFNANYDEVINYNYVMYQNESYSDKWFYGFITNVRYISNGSVGISFQLDYYQTWMFDITFKPSFVEREHVNDDTIGKHTIPEGLETGDYVVNYENINNQFTDLNVIIASHVDPVVQNDEFVGGNVSGGVYNKIMQGFKYYYFLNSSTSSLKDILKCIDKAGKGESVEAVFLAPSLSFDRVDNTEVDNGRVKETYVPKYLSWDNSNTGDTAPTKLRTLDGYQPVNNKLLTFPYCYLRITNNNGKDAIYHFEKFNNIEYDECYFGFMCTICPGMSIICYPTDYDNITNNFNECLEAGKFPICGWSSDVYTNWLTQNGVNIASNLIGSSLQLAAGVGGTIAGGGVGSTLMASNGIGGIRETLTAIYEHSFNPIQSRGATNTGDVKTSGNINTFTAYGMSIKKEYAKIIDDYLSMFGYKVCEIKIPNLTGRRNWNYIKTIGCNIIGNIPQMHLQAIKNMFDSGLTLWHNTATFLDYSQNNDIVV